MCIDYSQAQHSRALLANASEKSLVREADYWAKGMLFQILTFALGEKLLQGNEVCTATNLQSGWLV